MTRTRMLVLGALIAGAACKDKPKDIPPPKAGTASSKTETLKPPKKAPSKEKAAAKTPPGAEVPSKTFTLDGFHGVRVPAGGMAGPPPHGGRRMAVISYRVDRAKLVASLEALLRADGWKTTSRTRSPRGSLRLKVAKADSTLDVRVAGAGGRAAIIISK